MQNDMTPPIKISLFMLWQCREAAVTLDDHIRIDELPRLTHLPRE